MERKKICKIMVGSHLYGTNGPNSDRDYYGVFMPSRADLLSLHRYPAELSENVKLSEGARNAAGDVDSKFFSLSRFMLLAAEGQPGQLELLFAQEQHHVMQPADEWREIVANRQLFLSKRAIVPFIRFAEAQAHKAVMKGENLEKIRKILEWSQTAERKALGVSLQESLTHAGSIGTVAFECYTNDSGAVLIEIAGRAFDVATPVKRFVEALVQLESKYGTRSRLAAAVGVDWKSIHHALRLTFEAEDLLRHGEIVLPFTGDRLDFLCKLKQGELPDFDWSAELQKRVEQLTQSVDFSPLPDTADLPAIETLHAALLGKALAQ